MAFLTKGLRIILRDSRINEELEISNENEQIATLLERAKEDQAADANSEAPENLNEEFNNSEVINLVIVSEDLLQELEQALKELENIK